MSTPTIKAPLHLLSVSRIKDYLKHFTDKEMIVQKTETSLILTIDQEKIVIPLLIDAQLNLEPQHLINSLKEKGLIP
jgi:hypothetical protein|tara:strand:+ start:489 stop:719 length:231 start_codon:yes stop_codon:yes gene_type:complete